MRTLLLTLGLATGLASSAALAQTSARIDTVSIASRLLANRRTLRVLLPPGYDDPANAGRRYPVLYLHDGQGVFAGTGNWRGRWNVDEAIHRLTANGQIDPVIVVGIDNMVRLRAYEYLPFRHDSAPAEAPDPVGEAYANFVITEVVPLIDARYRTVPTAEQRALGGASFGGLITIYMAARHPGTFSRYLVESASLWVSNRAVLREIAATKWDGERFFFGVGTNEANTPSCTPASRENDMVTNTREAATLLQDFGVPAANIKLVVEPCATHDPGAWARRFPQAALFLLWR